MMKKLLAAVVLLFFVFALAGKEPKYIFLFIGDGMSIPQRMIADEFARKIGREGISFNQFPYQATTRTCSANRLITDSAAAATAIACGEKTDNGVIGLGPGGSPKLESVAEVAAKKGRKVGIITSVTLNHATPSGFYGHRKNRGQCYELGLDLIASGFDFFGGGGIAQHNHQKSAAFQGDIFDLAGKAGYTVAFGKDGLKRLEKGKKAILVGGSKASGLSYAIDANGKQPTLADIVEKAMELLDNPSGFFMMVEGGAIDWAGHANEAATNLHEVLALDDAVRKALAFMKKHPDETLIVVTGDHETGGMTMGFAGAGQKLSLELLQNQKCSVGVFKRMIAEAGKQNPNMTFEDAMPLLTKYFGFQFQGDGPMRINDKELKQLQEAFGKKRLQEAARSIINGKAGIGWTTGSHTSLPVLTTSIGVKAEIFTGFIENTDIARKLKGLL